MLKGLVNSFDSIVMADHLNPPFSPHGIIGQGANAETIGRGSPDIISHSNIHESELNGNGEVDITSLLARAHQQHELEKARTSDRSSHNGNNPSLDRALANNPLFDLRTWGAPTNKDTWQRPSPVLSETRFSSPGPLSANNLNIPPPGLQVRSQPEPHPLSIEPATYHHKASNGSDAMIPAIQSSPIVATGQLDQASQMAQHLSALLGLVGPMVGQADELERLKKEVEMWRGEWGRMDKERKRLEGVVAANELSMREDKPIKHPFTAVLIDGDGLIFLDKHIQAGYQGGQACAKILLSTLPNLAVHAESPLKIGASAPGLEVTVDSAGNVVQDGNELGSKKKEESKNIGKAIVQVFLNKSGLGTTLVKSACIPSWAVYESFWQGFSAAHELFTVIDVGPGKEATDAKIREHLRLYSRNAQCEMIFLGASHDNGYANVLQSLQTENRLSKLLLLKGYADLAPQLRQYSSRVVSIPDLFRTTKVPTATPSFVAITQQAPPPPAKVNKKAEPEPSSSPDGDSESVEVIQWDSVPPTPNGNGWETKKKDLGLGKKSKKNKGKPQTGHNGKTVREFNPRPCHTYYLGTKGCKAGEDCDYSHNYELDNGQLDELARLAKEMLCPFAKNNRCRFSVEDCVYGHQCPRMENCVFGETCRFNILPNAHGELDRA